MNSLKAVLAILILLVGGASAQAPHKPGAKARPPVQKAENPVYYGAIDLGSSGSKAALYSFVTDEDGISPKLLFSQTINTTLISSMSDGRFSKAGIADAAQAVTRLVGAMKASAAAKKITVDHFYIVGSSAVAKGLNKSDLVASVKDATGIDMDFIDAAHEGYYGLWSSVSTKMMKDALFIDIGSGNTKVGCTVGGTTFEDFKTAEIPYGSKSGRNEALKRYPKDIIAGIDSVMTDVGAFYNQTSMNIPCLRNRGQAYVVGGASWATATYTHPEGALSSFVTISRTDDIETFLANLKNETWLEKKPVYQFKKGTPAARQALIRDKAESDRADVKNVFVREDLLSGVSIMKTVLDISNRHAVVRFARNGNYIYGYARDKYVGRSNQAVLDYSPSRELKVQAPPPPPPPPVIRTLVVPAGTSLPVRVNETLNSETTPVGTTFTGTVVSPISIDGESAIPLGTPVTGRVVSVHDAAHFSGKSLLSVELTGLNRRGEVFTLTTNPFTLEGKGRGKNTAEKVGGGAAVGAILGGILGGGKGAAIGAASGGAVGAGANAVTKGQQVQITSEQLISFQLTNNVSMTSLGRMDSTAPGLQTR